MCRTRIELSTATASPDFGQVTLLGSLDLAPFLICNTGFDYSTLQFDAVLSA